MSIHVIPNHRLICRASLMLGRRLSRLICFLLLVVTAVMPYGGIAAANDRSSTDETQKEDSPEKPAAETQRVANGLQILFDFNDSQPDVIRSVAGLPLSLHVKNRSEVRRTAGAIEFTGETVAVSPEIPRLLPALIGASELTVEAWLQPANNQQDGPARIITFSESGTQRNFTLGQDGTKFDFRLRTSDTSSNGLPSLSTKKDAATTELTHVVYTRSRNGDATIFVNGMRNRARQVYGDFSSWKGDFRLAIGNEVTGNRSWKGKLYLVAVYNRALMPAEVKRNFDAGPTAESTGGIREPKKKPHPNELVFEDQVARILSNHCIECHDPANRAGDLDLSKQELAFAGGEGGPAIVPKKLDDSLLWEYVVSDEMPKDREPLSDDEKQTLADWIKDGAHWTLSRIDPVVYAHAEDVAHSYVRRLTIPEYIATVQATVDVDVSKEAMERLPVDLRADGFSNTAYNLTVDLKHVEVYAGLAKTIVDRMDVNAFVKRFVKRPKFTDKAMGELINKMGTWVLRGPITDRELFEYRGISTIVAGSGGDYNEAVAHILEAMLQSPRFIYRIENQRGDGGRWPVSAHELASRMSYTLWGASPDRQLMQAADDGRLYDPQQLEQEVDRMLADPRVVDRSLQFLDEWLNLRSLQNLRPNKQRFPNWNAGLAADMRTETRAFFEEVVWNQKRPVSDLLNAQLTFVTPKLATHYGDPFEMAATDDKPQRVVTNDLPGRGGLLTQGSVLTIGGDDASMVTRGLFVMHDLLRGVVKDPPPCVDTTPVATKAGLTQRAIAESRIKNQACGGCHVKFEPLSFGLERFDGLGRYFQQDEHGNQLREDGQILFPGAAKPISYQTSSQLMDLLAASPRVQESITWKLVQFSLGRPISAKDVPIIDKIHQSAQSNGGTYESLLRGIVLSELTTTTQTESQSE